MLQMAFAINDKDNSIISPIISLFTWSKCYHCEIVFSGGISLTADKNGVYFIKRNYDRYNWILIPLRWITKEDERKIYEAACEEVRHHNQYDFVGAILGRFSRVFDNPNKWFCSELCSFLLAPYLAIENKWYSPGDLWYKIAYYERLFREDDAWQKEVNARAAREYRKKKKELTN